MDRSREVAREQQDSSGSPRDRPCRNGVLLIDLTDMPWRPGVPTDLTEVSPFLFAERLRDEPRPDVRKVGPSGTVSVFLLDIVDSSSCLEVESTSFPSSAFSLALKMQRRDRASA